MFLSIERGITQMNYLIKTDSEGYRHVYRIESESQSHYAVTNPLFNCFGSVFNTYGRKRTITRKWVERNGYVKMDPTLAKKYDAIKKGDSCEVLYD